MALSLTDEDTGEVVRKRGDYDVRQRVLDEPISMSYISKNIPVCHSKIRSFEWGNNLIIREHSHQNWWSPGNHVMYTKKEKDS